MTELEYHLLHEQLQKDCVVIGRFKLCLLLLMNDKNYPWFILVPAREHIREIYQLPQQDRIRLIEESSLFAELLQQHYQAEKLNIAAIGNLVPQLHVHHVVRYSNDPAWPAPVWGKHPPQRYSVEEIDDIRDTWRKILSQVGEFHF